MRGDLLHRFKLNHPTPNFFTARIFGVFPMVAIVTASVMLARTHRVECFAAYLKKTISYENRCQFGLVFALLAILRTVSDEPPSWILTMIEGAQMKLVSIMRFFKERFCLRAKSLDPQDSGRTESFNKETRGIAPACCEKLDNCPFFKEYHGNPVVKNKWIDIYCRNSNTSQKCERKKVYQRTGQRPPINMTPSGMMLAQ